MENYRKICRWASKETKISIIFDAISYLLKSGCQWRMLPKDFPPYNTVFYYFSKWKNEGIFEDLFIKIHIYLRVLLGRCECPSLGLIDSRSVKTSHHVDKCRGIDGNKKIKGRKQHLVVDTLGIPLAVVVHEANIHDSVGALQVFEHMRFKFPRLAKIIADGGYRGKHLSDTLKATLGCDLEVVLRPNECPSKIPSGTQTMDCRKVFRLVGKLQKAGYRL